MRRTIRAGMHETRGTSFVWSQGILLKCIGCGLAHVESNKAAYDAAKGGGRAS
jgi:hypothetical protein